MRALLFSAALVSAALSGCVRCAIPLNAPPYDASQWGWGPQSQFYVTRSYVGFKKDYPGVHPYRMVPPGVPSSLACGRSPGVGYPPAFVPPWPSPRGMAGPNAVVVDNSAMPNGIGQNLQNVMFAPGPGGPETVGPQMLATGALTPNGIVFPTGMQVPMNSGAPLNSGIPIAAAF
jgi:hypothetical protein